MIPVAQRLRPIAIVCFWLVMMLLLISREMLMPHHISRAYSLIIPPDLLIRDYWMGIYFNNKRAGYTATSIEPTKIKTASGYKIHSRTFLALSIMGVPRYVWFDGTSVIDRDQGLENFSFYIKSGGYATAVRGKMHPDKTLDLYIDSQNYHTQRRINFTSQNDVIFAGLLSPFDFFGKLLPGQTYVLEIFDPFTLNLEKTQIKIDKPEEIFLKDKKISAHKVRTLYKGLEVVSWVDQHGDILKQETPLGWTMIKETADEATSLDKEILSGKMDIVSLLSLPSNVVLERGKLSYMKVLISGLPPEFSIFDERQKAVENEPGAVEIFREDAAAIAPRVLPIRDAGFAAYLEPTVFIQSNEQEVINLAKEITRGEKDSWQTAIKITRWLYKNIEKVPTISIPSAIDVLKTRQGDCNEHTTLFVALARSLGIPAKICVGLVYQDGRFYYHAWPRLWVGQWVSVDPTFGQEVADPTHIKLLEGDIAEQAALLQILGKLKIEVKDYR